MTRRLALLLATLVFLPVVALAQAPASRTFPQTVTYESCSQSWAFACGMRDASGRSYGTAHQVTHCTRYELSPNGRITLSAYPGLVDSQGRYRIDGDMVHIELLDDDGDVRHRESFRLSEDRSRLGEMSLVVPAPAAP